LPNDKSLVNYFGAYERLIYRARHKFVFGPSHRHHIIPLSMGGDEDDPDNLVRLSIREHIYAHLLLYRAGHCNQIFAVVLLLQQARLRQHRWIRKWHTW
jgi:hypothetical protein